MVISKKVESLFWSKIDRSQYSPGGCWLWVGNRDRRFTGGKFTQVRPHIVLFVLNGGKWRPNSKPHHLCGNKRCVQPAHLVIQDDGVWFWAGVDKSDGPNGCWVWKRSKEGFGRGRFYTQETGEITAHRFAFLNSGGKLTKKRPWVLHKCHEFGLPDNRACCNPLHLKAGTPSENVQDSILTGTQAQIRKTHCPKGHLLGGDNLVKNHLLKRGSRECRTCYNRNAVITRRVRNGWSRRKAELMPTRKQIRGKIHA